MTIKQVIAAFTCAVLLTGCTSTSTTSEGEVTSASSLEGEASKVEEIEVTTTCGLHYADFLKLGSLKSADISSDHPEWVFELDGTTETWEYDNGSAEKISYWRDGEEGLSCYTRTFPINTANINSWINVELVGIDNLLGTVHERATMQGVSWYYEWFTDLESCKFQVYSTGVTGRYTGLVSFTRSGPTSYNQVHPNGEAEIS